MENIDHTTGKKPTRFIVVREFGGSQSMADAFGSIVERQASDGYEKWRSDHAADTGHGDVLKSTVNTA
ncbi:MAG: hypothetical protein J5943_07090 [Oribacterium sp.]|nr:hypothetical protein [Oribacterium sp.]